MARTFGQNQPISLDKDPGGYAPGPGALRPGGETPRIPPVPTPTKGRHPARPRASRFGAVAYSLGGFAALLWLMGFGAFLWGWLGPAGMADLSPVRLVLLGAVALFPPLLFVALATALARSVAMGEAARVLVAATDRLFAADEAAAHDAARLARLIRRELDGLNAGLDGAHQRMRALEQVLEAQIAGLDEAGARAEVRGQVIAERLSQETRRVETLGEGLSDAAARASETVAGRAAQLKAMLESAEGTLKMATQALDVQTAGFRAAVTSASEAPHEAAVELDRQAALIEDAAVAAATRAEFVLARQEKQRVQLGEIVTRLEQEGTQLDDALSRQRQGLEAALSALSAETRACAGAVEDGGRQLELLMVGAATRAEQLTGAFAREADRLKGGADAAATTLASLSAALKEAGDGARTLIGESAAQAKQDARLLVGEAMAECARLLRAAGEMSTEASRIRGLLAKTTEDVERHIIRLPALAQEEARRMRQLLAGETEQLLEVSARVMTTMQARAGTPRPAGVAADEAPKAEPENEGLKGLARKLTARRGAGHEGRGQERGGGKAWEMRTLLAAADQNGNGYVGGGASLAALEGALSDLAINLAALDRAPMDDDGAAQEWKQYLAGDRSVFARRLAQAIDSDAVDRVTTLYRDDKSFHDAADAYISEFERLLERAKGDEGGGLLTSTLLSADTGKVYLAIAYALGRL